MKNKTAAMEMSMNTIVVVVLSVSFLILAFILMNTIYKSSKGAIDLTDSQLRDQIGKLFSSEDKKIVIYPQTGLSEIKQGKLEAVGVGVKNILTGASETNDFYYNISYNAGSSPTCHGSENIFNSWIVAGKSGNMKIPTGDFHSEKVRIKIPVGSQLCLARYNVYVYSIKNNNKELYASSYFDIQVKPK